MKRLLLTTITMILLVTSCKESTKEQQGNNEATTDKEVSQQLEIKFSFKTDKKDVFKIMMNNIKVDDLQKKNIQIFETVSPTSDFESITAQFGEGNMSKNIVFSLGNKKVKEVTIENITVSYKNKAVDITTPKDMGKFLRFNKHVVTDSLSMTIKTKKIDGKHSPSFTFRSRLLNRLNKD